MKFFIISLLILLILGFFLFFYFILAYYDDDETDFSEPSPEEPPSEEPPPEEKDKEPVCNPCDKTYYRCTAGCDGELQEQTCEECCGGGCSGWSTIEDCSSWQMCDASARSCSCEGECLETPENPRYYDNPTYGDLPDKNKGNSNIFLPVKLDWDDVEGWGKEDGPQSYAMRITTSTGAFSDILDKSEYIPGACRLPSNKTSGWEVKACCGADGTNCGQESNWNLSTNLAPELVSPYDPDWVGPTSTKNVALPTNPDWCDVEQASSTLLRVYVLQGGEKICHPNLLSTKEGKEFCDPWIIRKTRRDIEQLEKTLFSDFLDEDMYFFAATTTYLWEVATCLDDSGLNCKDFSQQWTFTTKEATSSEAFLASPPNDPSGQKPVGLPLILDWRKDAGINSWQYKIDSKQGITNVSQSRSFDYPELSLNTFYQWQALSCFDYEGKKCQDSWSETYTFKTTGQPPNLIYPASGAVNIVIPVNFDWQDAGGAKSYIFKIQGAGLSLEKPVDKSEFSLDYPDLKMLTDYTWQVKTCAREKGQVCGQYGSPQNFKTFRISPPKNPSYPQNGGMLFTDEHFLSWEKVLGAKAYQYEIKLLSVSPEEKSQECSVPPLKTSLANSDYMELGCLGQYQWQTKACLDVNCREASEWSSSWTFTFLEGGTGSGGLVPCGRSKDNPNTPWSEREPCEIKHLFLSIKIIFDFLLLRVMPIILVLLTIATGVMFYTSLGRAFTMAQIISLWKAAGIGLGLIFFAWTIVNLLLRFAGYNISIFGNWYSL